MATIKTRTTVEKDIIYNSDTAYNQYRKNEVVIPEGYEWTGEFRCIKLNDIYLGTDGLARVVSNYLLDHMFTAYPRFILREIPKISEPVKKSFIFKFIRHGIPKLNEWVDNGMDTFYLSNGNATGYYDIYERITL